MRKSPVSSKKTGGTLTIYNGKVTSTTSPKGAFRTYCEMIKIEHSIFALPFALIGMMWGSQQLSGKIWPGFAPFFWILVAMVSCRSAAMAYNRIADREIDALNPRTKMRALPAGLLSLRQTTLFFYGSIVLFVVAAASLNPLALRLSPIALIFTLGYSMTKRFTWLCHWVLGFSLGIAPSAAFIGVTGKLSAPILWITAAVTLWTAGFDLIYAMQDDQVDREQNLHSFPANFGRKATLITSRICHFLSIAFLLTAGYQFGAGDWYFIGCAACTALLGYEQTLVKTDDLSKVNLAFFTLNGYVSIGMFIFALIDLAL